MGILGLTPTPKGEELEGRMLSKEEIYLYWDEIRASLEAYPELWETYYSVQSILELLTKEHWQAFVFGRGSDWELVVFTQIVVYPKGRFLQFVFACGVNLELYVPLMFATFQRFAQITNCVQGEIFGRPGWGRIFKKHGAKFELSVYTLPVLKPGGLN